MYAYMYDSGIFLIWKWHFSYMNLYEHIWFLHDRALYEARHKYVTYIALFNTYMTI